MAETSTIYAGCKVNLYLEITGILDNGYHELRTLFIPLPRPCDTLEITTGAGQGFRLVCDIPELASDSNLIAKAYRVFAAETGYEPDMTVRLVKEIPMGAGVGGGSSDAAAMLGHLNARAGKKSLPEKKLYALAAGLGADVPFFLMNKPALATGIGDKLVSSDVDLAGLSLLLVCPEAHINTAWAYKEWDKFFGGKKDLSGSKFLTSDPNIFMQPLCLESPCLFNSFEQVVFPAYPGLRVIKEKLLAFGASGAVMSGSGSSMFALFRDKAKAAWAADFFKSSRISVYLHHL